MEVNGDIMSYIINNDVIEEIRDRVDIVELISEYVSLKRSGSNYVGLCPFHNEKTPSFSVSEQKKIFHCFGCGEGGDQISFIMKKENLGFREAVVFLADKYHIELQEYRDTDNELKNKKNRCYSANKMAAQFYFNKMRGSRLAYGYLKNRDIDNRTITKYAIGYAEDSWDSLYRFLSSKGYSDEELEEFNLIVKTRKGNYIDRFRNRIMFPIIDSKSRVIAFGGRVLDDSLPKYLNTRDTVVFNKGHNLYNLNIISKESERKRIILVEGYMDVISLYQHGINYSVASLGTALTENQAELIKRFGDEVYICYDGDSAGIKATKRAIDVLVAKNISPKIVNLKDGLDPDEYIKKYGKMKFEMELDNGLNYLEYKIMKAKENYNLETAEGLTKFTSEAAKILSFVKNPIEQDVYIDKVSRNYNVSKEAIKSYIKGIQNNSKKRYGNYEKKGYIKPEDINIVEARKKAEYQITAYALDNRDYSDYILDKIKPYEFKDMGCRLVMEEIESAEDLKKVNILEILKEKKLIDDLFIKGIMSVKIDIVNYRKVIDELIGTVNKDQLEENRDRILNSIKELENSDDAKDNLKLKELIEKLNELNTRLKFSQ